MKRQFAVLSITVLLFSCSNDSNIEITRYNPDGTITESVITKKEHDLVEKIEDQYFATITVFIRKDNTIEVEEMTYDDNQFQSFLSQDRDKPIRVILKPEFGATNGRVFEIMNLVKTAGIEDVQLSINRML